MPTERQREQQAFPASLYLLLKPFLPLKPTPICRTCFVASRHTANSRASHPLKLGTGMPSGSYIHFLLQFLEHLGSCFLRVPTMSLSLPQTSRSSLENHFNELTKRETWKLDQRSCALETARSPSWL